VNSQPVPALSWAAGNRGGNATAAAAQANAVHPRASGEASQRVRWERIIGTRGLAGGRLPKGKDSIHDN
jgi:hypothetical protein